MLSSRTFCIDGLHLPFSCAMAFLGSLWNVPGILWELFTVVGGDQMFPNSPVVVLFPASWYLILHMASLVFSQRLKETHLRTSGARYLHGSSCLVLSPVKSKYCTLPELQSLCPQLCETSCSAGLLCSALGFGNCFQETWAIIGLALFVFFPLLSGIKVLYYLCNIWKQCFT